MLVKLSSKNQLTLPRAVLDAVGNVECFDVAAEDGRIVLVPLRLSRADAVRRKLQELGIGEADIRAAIGHARGNR